MMKSVFRTGVLTVLLGGMLLAMFWQLTGAWHLRAIEERDRIITEMTERLAQKEAMLTRLGRTRRMAHIEVLSQHVTSTGEIEETTIRFIELDDDGREVARQDLVIPGGVLFVDTWTAKFAQGDVASGNPLRGRTIVLLRRIYSENLAPRDGFPLDTPGAIPAGYAATEVAEFERVVWQNFWAIATDPETADRFGVRIAQGEVVYKPVRAGQMYELMVDAAGGINLTPIIVATRAGS